VGKKLQHIEVVFLPHPPAHFLPSKRGSMVVLLYPEVYYYWPSKSSSINRTMVTAS
jgi:hypothetical protein